MTNHIEINLPKAYETYNGKGVGFYRLVGERPVPTEGKFLVGGNSKWMQIDWLVSSNSEEKVFEHIPVSPEILQDIQPAPQSVLEASKAPISFVIPTPIRTSPLEYPGKSSGS